MKQINSLLKKCKVNSILLLNFDGREENFYYFSELEFGQFENNVLILKKNSKPIILTTILEFEELKKSRRLKVIKLKSEEQYKEILRKELKGNIGVNFDLMPVNYYRKLSRTLKQKLIDVSKQLRETRAVKTKKEINIIKNSVKITENILKEVPKIIKMNSKKHKINLTEKQLAGILEEKAKKRKAQELSFPVIVASGRNGKTPHYIPSNKKIKKGFLLIDFGIRYKNYCSDLSRTFYVGKATKKEKKLYEIVFETKIKAEKIIKPGIEFQKVFLKAENNLKKEGFELIHGLGHGVGLRVHDEPKGFTRKTKEKIRKENVLTIEPGIYGKFGGIRIEDMLTVENKGIEKLSKAPKKLIEIKI